MRVEAVLVAVLLAGGCASVAAPAPAPAPVSVPPSASASGSGPLPLPAASDVRPVRLRIPAIGVDAAGLVPLALGPDHALQAPASFFDVGWYAAGPPRATPDRR